MAEPIKFDLSKGTLTPIDTSAPKKFDLSKGTMTSIKPQDFTGGLDNTEGKFTMIGPKGTIQAAYSMVGAASQAGYQMAPSDRKTYLEASANEPNIKNRPAGAKVKVVGRNTAGQPMLAPGEPFPLEGGKAKRLLSAAGSALADTAKGMYHAVIEGPQNPEEGALLGENPGQNPTEYSPFTGRVALIAKRLFGDPAISEASKAKEEFKQVGPWPKYPSEDQKGHFSKAVGHGLAAVVPGAGPWAAQVAEQIGTKIGTGDIAGAEGTLGGNAALYLAPHTIGTAANIVADAPRGVLEAVSGTSPRELRVMAEDVHKVNQEAIAAAKKADIDNDEKHLEKTQEAIHDTKGAEAQAEYDNNAATEKARADHAAEVAKVNEHNKRVIAKHKAVSEKIKRENDAAEHALDLRRAEEAKLKKETDDYYAKEDAVKAKVKSGADSKWKPIHTALDDKTIDGGYIETPLKNITAISPEVAREVKQLIPDPDDAAPDSSYAKARAQIIKETTGSIEPDAYEKLDAFNKKQVDRWTEERGFTPDPIDLDPKTGVGIPFDKIHRAQSIIGRNIRNGRYGYEGTLLGELIQLHKVLYNAESKIATDNGLSGALGDARQATRELHEAFGTERNRPKTQLELREQQANPEDFKERSEQKRVDAAKKHDPSLASDYEKVKAHRDAVKKLHTEDQLRKGKKQIPPPPTVDDLREGYRLKPPPAPKEPKLTQPERAAHPDRPDPVKPKTKQITPEDYAEHMGKNIGKSAGELRRMGLRRALYATLTGIPFGVTELFKGFGAKAAASTALYGVAAGGVVLGGSHLLADLVERPDVKAWLSKVSDRHAEAWEKLPPEQKALFTEDMKAIVEAAREKGIPVSPALTAFVAGTAVSQGRKNNSPADLKKQAEELQHGFHQSGVGPKPETSPAAPGPQSSTRVTHKFNPTTGQIEAA